MSKIIFVLVWCMFTLFGLASYQIGKNSNKGDTTACPSPQHEGEKTIATLIKHEGGLKLLCEKHSTLKYTSSPNKGEKK